nr:hypothetical protein [Tanacetum cinerariifolium]
MFSKNEFGDLDLLKLTEQEDDDVIIEEYDEDDGFEMIGGAEGYDGIAYLRNGGGGGRFGYSGGGRFNRRGGE